MISEEIEDRIRKNKEAALRKLEEKKNRQILSVGSGPIPSSQLANDALDFVATPASSGDLKRKSDSNEFNRSDSVSLKKQSSKMQASVRISQPLKPIKINFQVTSGTHFSVHSEYRNEISSFLRNIPNSSYDPKLCVWVIPIEHYSRSVDGIQHLSSLSSLQVSLIPEAVWSSLLSADIIQASILPAQLMSSIEDFRQKATKRAKTTASDIVIPDLPFSLSFKSPYTSIDQKLVNALLPFQRDGVEYGISREGRILIADDMGLGKTIQALCIACYYRSDWPLLVIVPSSLRMTWVEAFKEWTPSIDPNDIQVILSSPKPISVQSKHKKSADPHSALITITSYDMAARHIEPLRAKRYQIVIADESHFLKNMQTKRAKYILPLLKSAKRAILLSGTPALSRPLELYTQIQAIRPSLFPRFQDYAQRYCDARPSWFGWDYSGASNLTELQLLLDSTIMIRRLKGDVLSQLPPKRRQQIFLQIKQSDLKTFQLKLKNLGEFEMDKGLAMKQQQERLTTRAGNDHFISSQDSEGQLLSMMMLETVKETNTERKKKMIELWKESSMIKLDAMIEYVTELLDGGRKVLLFAHHQDVLDAFNSKISVPFIRIDGNTQPAKRQSLCQDFQTKDDIRIAYLSITAASVGLTLTAASTVVFAELYWNPGVISQAEDRAHRIGQRDSVNVHYLLARGTLDDRIWPLLVQKLEVLQSVGLAKENELASQIITLPQKGQKTLTSYFSSPSKSSPNSTPSITSFFDRVNRNIPSSAPDGKSNSEELPEL